MTVNSQKIKHILPSFDIKDKDIYNIIKTIDINKTHGHDEVPIRILKQYNKSRVKPLYMIFKNCNFKYTFL